MTILKEDVVGVVLAGGLARRMGGGDKCLLQIAGQSLLARSVERLAPQVSSLIINANGDAARFSSFDQPIVPDTIEGYAGPLAGVLAGLRWVEREAPQKRYILSVASDTPFFPLDLNEKMMRGLGDREQAIVLAASNGQVHPVFGLWPVALADHLEETLRSGVRKILDWSDMHEMIEVPFEDSRGSGSNDQQAFDPFFNVNRPDDLAKAEEVVGRFI